MKTRALCVAVALVLSGCAGTPPKKTVTEPSPAASSPQPPQQVPPAAPAAPVTPSSPSTSAAKVDEAGYLTALGAIDQGLVVNRDRALRRGTRVCEKIRAGEPEAKIVEYAALEFDGGNASVDQAKATRIVVVVRRFLCA